MQISQKRGDQREFGATTNKTCTNKCSSFVCRYGWMLRFRSSSLSALPGAVSSPYLHTTSSITTATCELIGELHAVMPLARGVSGYLLDTLMLILYPPPPHIHIFVYNAIVWKRIGTPNLPPNMYFWTPNSEILAKALHAVMGLLQRVL